MSRRRRNIAKRSAQLRTSLRSFIADQRTTSIYAPNTISSNEPEAEQYVDLTCEDQNDSYQYVDLTSADTSTVVLDTPRLPATPPLINICDDDHGAHAANFVSPLLLSDSSDSETDLPPLPFTPPRRDTSSSSARAAVASSPQSSIVCPICLDGVTEIKQNGRQVMATNCGHIFCSECLRGVLTNRVGGSRCPNCRKKLNEKAVHPLFI